MRIRSLKSLRSQLAALESKLPRELIDLATRDFGVLTARLSEQDFKKVQRVRNLSRQLMQAEAR